MNAGNTKDTKPQKRVPKRSCAPHSSYVPQRVVAKNTVRKIEQYYFEDTELEESDDNIDNFDPAIFAQDTECDSQSESDENNSNNKHRVTYRNGVTPFDLDTECETDTNTEPETIENKNQEREKRSMHEARCNNEKSNLRLKMKPYKKRLIHQQLQEKNNCDEESESDSEHNNNNNHPFRRNGEKDEKSKSGWRKPSRKQFRHQDISVFKPESVATSFLLKPKDLPASIKKPDNKETITKSIVMKLAGQLKPDSMSNTRPATFGKVTQLEEPNSASGSGMHNLPAIVPETLPARRKSYDYSGQNKPVLRSSRQHTSDMPALSSDTNNNNTTNRKPVKGRRKTIAGPEFLEPETEQDSNRTEIEFSGPYMQQPPRRRYSVTIPDTPMDLTSTSKPFREDFHTLNSDISNGLPENATGAYMVHTRQHPEAVPSNNAQANEDAYNKNIYSSSRNGIAYIPPTPYYTGQKLVATPASYSAYQNAMDNQHHINNSSNQEPSAQNSKFANMTAEQFFPDESLLKPSIKSLSLYMKTNFTVEVLRSIANLYQKISKILADDRITYKSKQSAQKCLNEAYGYVAQKLPEVNLSPALVNEALLNSNFFNQSNCETNTRYSPQIFPAANGSMQVFSPVREINPISSNNSKEHHPLRAGTDTYDRGKFLQQQQQHQLNPIQINQEENNNLNKYQHTFDPSYRANLTNKSNSASPVRESNSLVSGNPRARTLEMQKSNVPGVPNFNSQNNHNQYIVCDPRNHISVPRKEHQQPPIPSDVNNMYPNRNNGEGLNRKNLTLNLKTNNNEDTKLVTSHPLYSPERLRYQMPRTKDNRDFLDVPEGLQIIPCPYNRKQTLPVPATTSATGILQERVLSNPAVIVRDNSMEITKAPLLQNTRNHKSVNLEDENKRSFYNIKESNTNHMKEDSEFKRTLTDLLEKYQSKIPKDTLKTLLLDQYWQIKKEEPTIANGEIIQIDDSDCDDRSVLNLPTSSKTLKRKSYEDSQKNLEQRMSAAIQPGKPPVPPMKKLHSPDQTEKYLNSGLNKRQNPNEKRTSLRPELHVKGRTPPSIPPNSRNKAIYSPEIEPISPVANEKTFTFPPELNIYTTNDRANGIPNEVLNRNSTITSSTSKEHTRSAYESHKEMGKHIHDSNQTSTSPCGKKQAPNGKLCYDKESNTFIRYFDDSQVELFMRNLNLQNEKNLQKTDGDRRRLSPFSVNYMGGIGRTEQVIKIPKNIVFSNKEDISDPVAYVHETELVKKHAPEDFASFYLFVTGYQIVRYNHPISFQTFLTMYNTNRLQELLDKYLGHEQRS